MEYHEKREAVGKILRLLCDWKEVKNIQVMPRPWAYAGRDTAKDGSIESHGIPEGKERYEAVRTIRGTEIQEPRVRGLCGHDR